MPYSRAQFFPQGSRIKNTDLYNRLLGDLPVTESDKLSTESEINSLTLHVNLWDAVLGNITQMQTTRGYYGSYIQHIKNNKVDNFKTDNIKTTEIIGDMRMHRDLIEGYQLFKKILDDLELIKAYFDKTPSSDRADFMRLHQFHKQQIENCYKTMAKQINQWKSYYQFVSDVLDTCGKIPGLIPSKNDVSIRAQLPSRQP